MTVAPINTQNLYKFLISRSQYFSLFGVKSIAVTYEQQLEFLVFYERNLSGVPRRELSEEKFMFEPEHIVRCEGELNFSE